MKKLEKYYPIILAAFSVAYSNYLWFSGNQLEGIYVGLWPVTILAFWRCDIRHLQFFLFQNCLKAKV